MTSLIYGEVLNKRIGGLFHSLKLMCTMHVGYKCNDVVITMVRKVIGILYKKIISLQIIYFYRLIEKINKESVLI